MRLAVHKYVLTDYLIDRLTSEEQDILEGSGLPFFDDPNAFAPLDSLEVHASSNYLCFGRTGGDGLLALDFNTRNIVELTSYSPEPGFVNSSLQKYQQTFLRFAKGLPYDADPDAVGDPLGEQADSFRQVLLSIDPPSAAPETLWFELSWDIANGDWDSASLGLAEGEALSSF